MNIYTIWVVDYDNDRYREDHILPYMFFLDEQKAHAYCNKENECFEGKKYTRYNQKESQRGFHYIEAVEIVE